MTSLSLAIGKPTLADRLFSRGLVVDGLLITVGAVLTAICAQFSIYLWPVPITGQTLAVLLVGSSLGSLRGTLSMVLYGALGVVGLPVFADSSSGLSVLMGPTGGYIIGFIFAAAFTGWLAQIEWDRKILRSICSFLAGTVVIYLFGLPWLAISLHLDLGQTLQAGFYPFIIGGVIKSLIAAGVVTLGWKFVDREDRRNSSRFEAE